MKYLWFLPAELIPPVATLLVVIGGLALMLQRKAVAISLFIFAGLLVAMPAFDPIIDEVMDSAIGVGLAFLHQWPWWVDAGVIMLLLLLLLQIAISLIFNQQVANHAVGALIARGIWAALRAIFVAPIMLLGTLIRNLFR